METIDLRSDTVTRPGKAMREAMFNAPVGDDVYGEDESVNQLEEYAATLFGKEAGLFCPTGTMTNQVAIKVHTRPGDELICDANAHIFNYESGGIAFNSGVQARLVQGEEGRVTPALIESCFNGPQDWLARTSLVSIENTVNRAGGSYYTLAQMKAVSEFCREKSLKLHLDGARLFNALEVSKDNPSSVGPLFDSVSICLSKGLGAPVGSVLLADRAFIAEARRVRKVLGGGMRQAGVIASAGLYALKNNLKRLKDDHIRADRLGKTLQALPFVEKVLPVYTNIVIFHLNPKMSGTDFEKKLAAENIRVAPFGKQTVRMVTHLDYTDEMLERTIKVLSGVK